MEELTEKHRKDILHKGQMVLVVRFVIKRVCVTKDRSRILVKKVKGMRKVRNLDKDINDCKSPKTPMNNDEKSLD